ncbi:hypothetical protein [Streptomyces misionensis]|uniref:hypothetical protein n=1 Tax=Streptomyces misionensis TaxID=67331 RepID=UPI00396C0001
MTAAEYLDRFDNAMTPVPGTTTVPSDKVREAHALAIAALATRDTIPNPTEPWPTGITARILTRAAILTGNHHATVDIHDDTRSTANCTSCGWTKSHGNAYRSEVIDWAQDHANQCTALPQPTA